jgi:hypothetical protein
MISMHVWNFSLNLSHHEYWSHSAAALNKKQSMQPIVMCTREISPLTYSSCRTKPICSVITSDERGKRSRPVMSNSLSDQAKREAVYTLTGMTNQFSFDIACAYACNL